MGPHAVPNHAVPASYTESRGHLGVQPANGVYTFV